MPPTFAYAMALMAYIAVACIVWGVAVLLAIPRGTRCLAGRVAAGMAGSFPGVFLFQVLSAPIVAVILLTSGLIMSVTSRGGWIDAALLGMGIVALATFVFASVAGFYMGWRAGWEVAAGRSGRGFLRGHSILGGIFRALGRWVPALRMS
jgi:hypothetical protein